MTIKSSKDYQKDYTHPELREKLKEEIKNGSKGANPGQWSARKSQLLKKEYEEKGEGTNTAVKRQPLKKIFINGRRNISVWQKS